MVQMNWTKITQTSIDFDLDPQNKKFFIWYGIQVNITRIFHGPLILASVRFIGVSRELIIWRQRSSAMIEYIK